MHQPHQQFVRGIGVKGQRHRLIRPNLVLDDARATIGMQVQHQLGPRRRRWNRRRQRWDQQPDPCAPQKQPPGETPATAAAHAESRSPDRHAVVRGEPHAIARADAERLVECLLVLRWRGHPVHARRMAVDRQELPQRAFVHLGGPQLCPREEAALRRREPVDRAIGVRVLAQMLLQRRIPSATPPTSARFSVTSIAPSDAAPAGSRTRRPVSRASPLRRRSASRRRASTIAHVAFRVVLPTLRIEAMGQLVPDHRPHRE